jgi:hypothetical protein
MPESQQWPNQPPSHHRTASTPMNNSAALIAVMPIEPSTSHSKSALRRIASACNTCNAIIADAFEEAGVPRSEIETEALYEAAQSLYRGTYDRTVIRLTERNNAQSQECAEEVRRHTPMIAGVGPIYALIRPRRSWSRARRTLAPFERNKRTVVAAASAPPRSTRR